MAVTSSSRVSKAPKRSKGGTAHTKNHHFETFTQRIAKLKIDPISKTRRHGIDHGDLESTTSHFSAGLSEWRELNLSENFSDFVQEVDTLCDSLPQILHSQDKIMDIMVRYLEKRDALSLEPLLGLLSQFAHDLGTRFEKHFARALSVVTGIAASHSDVQVIEWSFTSLAWLFKYLSRLLIPDLRPTFDIMSPLLGKAHPKPHIARFAAEAMSFLIRKAALGVHKNKEPLVLIVGHSIDDLRNFEESTGSSDLYRYGLMNLYADSIKGINNGLHSSAYTIFKTLLEVETEKKSVSISAGVLVNLVHHTNATTFAPLLDTIAEIIGGFQADIELAKLHAHAELCFLTASVRKGSRINNWKSLIDTICKLQQCQFTSDSITLQPSSIEKAAAAAFQYAPLDIVIPSLRGFMEKLGSKGHTSNFLSFCTFYDDLGHDRFDALISPYFYKFISSSWQKDEEGTIQAILQVAKNDSNVNLSGTRPRTIPVEWSKHILTSLHSWDVSLDDNALSQGYLDLLDIMSVSKESEAELARALERLVAAGLDNSANSAETSIRFAIGRGLKSLIGLPVPGSALTILTWTRLLDVGQQSFYMPSFIRNLKHLCGRIGVPDRDTEKLLARLCENLMSLSKDLREASLELLSTIHRAAYGRDCDALQTAMTIETLPLSLQSVRVISMHARKLPTIYKSNEDDLWSNKIIPRFLFGLLTYQLSPVWMEAVDALKNISNSTKGESMVSEIAFRWLAHVKVEQVGHLDSTAGSQGGKSSRVNEFQCTNVEALNSKHRECAGIVTNSKAHLAQRAKSSQRTSPVLGPNARAQALRVFNGIAWIAEKRSRQVVPYLFDWMGRDEPETDDNVGGENEKSVLDLPAATYHSHTTKQERKALLEIFGAFTNPRVLYRSEDVFNALLQVLTNGDSDMQKLALRAIFTWNLHGVKPYQENLLNIIDDARFREELSVFLQTENESGLRSEHKPELMPILLRLLYGKITARTGASSNKASQGTRRRAVFDSLAKFADTDIEEFVKIVLGPLHKSEAVQNVATGSKVSETDIILPRRQLGLLNMIKDMLDVFGHRLSFLVPVLAPSIMHSLAIAASRIQQATDDFSNTPPQLSLYRDMRQVGIQCLNQMFARCSPQMLRPYTPLVFKFVILPRLDKLPIETAQGISGVLRLVSTWANNIDNAHYMLDHEAPLVPKVAEIMDVASAKDEVKMFAINDILKPLIRQSQTSEAPKEGPKVSEAMLQPYANDILGCAGDLLEKSPSKTVLTATIELVSMMSNIVSGSSQVQKLLAVTSFLIDQPIARVPARAKGDLLHILERLAPYSSMAGSDDLFERLYRSISALFKYFNDRENRTRLCAALKVLSQIDSDLALVAKLCEDLNSYSSRAIDEPDFDRRLQAFSQLNDSAYGMLSERQWRPLLFNYLYYLRDDEELAVRSSASFGVRRFVEASKSSVDAIDTSSPGWMLVRMVLLPALMEGSAEKSELVRTEYMAIMAHLIRAYPEWNEISDMSALLVNDDDEASFFSNVLHIQQHRRLRALRRLADEANKQGLRSMNIAHFLLPLLEHFIFDRADDSGAHNLAAEATITIGALVHGLEWPQIRAVFQRYAGYISSKPELEKSIIRLLGVLIDAIQHAASAKMGNDQAHSEVSYEPSTTKKIALALTIPRQEKLSDDVVKNILPSLLSYLHNKDESTVSLRVPVAVSAVKLMKVLPEASLVERLPPLLTDVCHILRSRAQESRDMTRKTLVDIAALVGPSYFGFILKELRAALARGYQLHVLSYTVHSILVETAPLFNSGELDYCLPQVVAVIMDDIFGTTGQEKDAEEYISKMKEVKSSKSYDSMELLTKTASISRLASLVRPIQSLLDEKLDLQTVKKTDELLRRMGLGLLRNAAVESQDTLIFCYEVIQHAYRRAQQPKSAPADSRTKRFLVNTKGARFGPSTRSTSSFGYKLTKFAFDLLRIVLHKHENLKTPASLSGFMPAIGDAILEAHEEVQISVLRLVAEIIKVDMKELDRDASIYVSEAVKLVKNAISTNSEISQAALKLITAVLQERNKAAVKETDIAFLLTKARPDFEEPDRQGLIFNFLKAVLARKIVITEVYETMDAIAAMMITNQSHDTRVKARRVYFDFLMNYPQGKDRLSKQIKFLLKNLDYKRAEGRQSVMEAIHSLISKSPPELMSRYSTTFFVPLVLVTINDDSSKCREMAGALIKTLFEKCNDDQSQDMLKMMRTWISSGEQRMLVRASLQIYGTIVDVDAADGGQSSAVSGRLERDLPMLEKQIVQLLKSGLMATNDNDWELIYYTLQLVLKLVVAVPDRMLTADQANLWVTVRQCSFFPHAWVKFAAASLLGHYFTDFARTNSELGAVQRPLKGSHGLRLNDDEMITMMRAFLRSLKIPGIGEGLATQLARNLVFLGQYLPASTEQLEDEAESNSSEPELEELEEEPKAAVKPPLRFMFERLSAILRHESISNKAPALIAKMTALRIIASLSKKLQPSTLETCMQTVLLPLLNFTDPSFTPPFSTDEEFHATYKSIVSSSHEILGVLQQALGTTIYVREIAAAQNAIKARREERRIKRRLEAVAEPEKIAQQKKRKIEREKLKRKEKVSEFRNRRRGW